jgi:hypothetical protein
LAAAAEKSARGVWSGRWALGFRVREDVVLRTLTEDVLKRGNRRENLDADQVRSSVARRLGIDIGVLRPADRHVEVVEMI